MSWLPSPLTSRVDRLQSRGKDAARQRIATVREREHRQTAQLASDELAFGGGYLVHPSGVPQSPEVAGWPTRTIEGHTYHARTRITASRVSTGGALAVIGHPIDVDTGDVSPQRITGALAALAAQGTEALLRRAAYLGGRWTLLWHGPDGVVTVLTDALASQQVWHSPSGRTIASHAALVQDGILLPTNSVLHVTNTSGVAVRRYYPWAEDDHPPAPPVTNPSEAYAAFSARIVAHTRLLCTFGRPGIWLTGGHAGQAVLASYLPNRQDGGYTFTTFAPKSAHESREQATVMYASSRLSFHLGMPHRVVRDWEPPSSDVFSVAYRRTFPLGTSASTAFARSTLPGDTVELHPAGGDVVDLDSWELLDRNYLDGDLTHRVMLPFNDRRLLEIMLSLPPDQRAEASLVSRLAAELEAS